jgi:magnesium transporter
MAGFMVVVVGRDRPGLLRDSAGVLAYHGLNIVFSVGRRVDRGRALLLFVAEGDQQQASRASRSLLGVEGVEEVRYAQLGSTEASRLTASVLDVAPELAASLAAYLGPGGLVDALAALGRGKRLQAIRSLSPELLRELLEHGGEVLAEDVAEAVGVDRLASVVAEMDADEAVDLLQRLPSRVRAEVVKRLPRSRRELVSRLIRYPPDSAGGIMVVGFQVVRADESVSDVARKLKEGRARLDVRDVVVVVDGRGRLVGLVDVLTLATSPPSARVGSLAARVPVTVSPWTRLEDLLVLVTRYGLRRIPVVDAEGRVLGLVLAEDLAEAVASEYYGSMSMLEGLEPTVEPYRAVPLVRLLRKRLPWVLGAYGVEALVPLVVRSFETLIAKLVAVAAFAPLVMALAGIIGGQSVAMAVRAVSLREVDPRRLADSLPLLAKVTATALLLALIVATASYAYATLVVGHQGLALAVALAHLAATAIASVTGFLLPLAVARAGADPAVVSSPVMQTSNDLVAAAIYFTIAVALV